LSVYVGIDVHRKRSQVAVVSEDGTVQLNKKRGERLRADAAADRRSAPRGRRWRSRPRSAWGLAGRPAGRTTGFEAHLVHPLRCKAIASARLKNDKGRRGDPGAAAGGADLLPEAPGGSHPRRCAQLRAPACGTGPALVRLGTQHRNRIPRGVQPPTTGYDRSAKLLGTGPGRGWLAELDPARGLAGDRQPTCLAGDRTPWRR